jgi:hypothetical protein
LADLTFIEEVPSHLKTGQVNFEKMHLVSKVISEVERYQKTPYKFYPVVPIEEYLENVTTLPGAFHTTHNDDDDDDACDTLMTHTHDRLMMLGGGHDTSREGVVRCGEEVRAQRAGGREGGDRLGATARHHDRQPPPEGAEAARPRRVDAAVLPPRREAAQGAREAGTLAHTHSRPDLRAFFVACDLLAIIVLAPPPTPTPTHPSQEKKLQRSISFRMQQKGRNRSSTYSG